MAPKPSFASSTPIGRNHFVAVRFEASPQRALQFLLILNEQNTGHGWPFRAR
jgi:hypothetical protein